MKLRSKFISAAALGLFVLAACADSPEPAPQPTASGSQSAAPVETANTDPITIVCGMQEDTCQAMVQAYTQATGIQTDYVRLSSGEAFARLEASRNSPEFDAWYGGPADGFGVAAAAGLLEAYESPNAAAIPAEYRDKDNFWTGIYVGVLGFCSNKGVLKDIGADVPESWEDLLNPVFSRNISSPHPSTSGTAFTMVYTQVLLNDGDVDGAFEYLGKLHNNILQYSRSGQGPTQLAGRGEVAVGIVYSHDCVKYQEEGMTDLVLTFPKEGTGYEIGGLGLIAGAKNPDGAKQFIDWALQSDTQEIPATAQAYQIPTHPDAAVHEKSAPLAQIELVDYDFKAAAEAKPQLTPRFDEEIAAQPRE